MEGLVRFTFPSRKAFTCVTRHGGVRSGHVELSCTIAEKDWSSNVCASADDSGFESSELSLPYLTYMYSQH